MWLWFQDLAGNKVIVIKGLKHIDPCYAEGESFLFTTTWKVNDIIKDVLIQQK